MKGGEFLSALFSYIPFMDDDEAQYARAFSV
jgi:hypothetical protein